MAARVRAIRPRPAVYAAVAVAALAGAFIAERSLGVARSRASFRAQEPCRLAAAPDILLRKGGWAYYVNPLSFDVTTDGEMLIAGAPGYATAEGRPARADTAEDNAVSGVIVSADGHIIAIPTPFPGRHSTGTRAIRLGPGRWGFVFDERATAPDSVNVGNRRVVALWFGIYDRQRGWGHLEKLPRSEGLSPRPITASLTAYGSELRWTLLADSRDAGPVVVVYTRARGRWTLDTIRAVAPAYASFASGDSTGGLLALVKPDPQVQRDGNSLFLYRRAPNGWQVLRKLATGGAEPVHHPRIRVDGGDTLTSWYTYARGRLRGAVLFATSQGLMSSVIDSVTTTPEPLEGTAGAPLWATTHPGDLSRVRIRLSTVRLDGNAQTLASRPTPFIHHFAVASASPSDLLLTGPAQERDSTLLSLIQRLHLQCPASAADQTARQ